MKRLIVLALSIFALAGGMAHAADAPKISANAQELFNALPADKQAEMLSQLTAAQQQVANPATVVEKVDKWVDLGEKVGKMMGGAAKEVGVAVNDFVKTDVGRWTMILVIWNYIGADAVDIAVHIGGALTLWLIGFSVLFYLMRKSCVKVIEYDTSKTNIFGNYPRKGVTRERMSDDDVATYIIASAVLLIIGVWMILCTM